MSRTAALLVALLAVQCGLATQAAACKGDKVLFEDDFSLHDHSWGAPEPRFLELYGGKATARPKPDSSYWQWNSGFAFLDADICLTVTLIETTDPAKSDAGLMFWIMDNDNFFVFRIASNGKYQVIRQVGGQWAQPVIPWTDSDAIKKGPNQPNTLRLTLKGGSIAVAINDKDLGRFQAQPPPKRAGFIGLYATSGPDKPSIWRLTNLKVTNVK